MKSNVHDFTVKEKVMFALSYLLAMTGFAKELSVCIDTRTLTLDANSLMLLCFAVILFVGVFMGHEK